MIIEDKCDFKEPILVGRKAPPLEVQIPQNDNILFKEFLVDLEKSKIKKTYFHFEMH